MVFLILSVSSIKYKDFVKFKLVYTRGEFKFVFIKVLGE